jgi:hypothetical protein
VQAADWAIPVEKTLGPPKETSGGLSVLRGEMVDVGRPQLGILYGTPVYRAVVCFDGV